MRRLAAGLGLTLATTPALAADLVAARPGVMCRSASALSELTRHDGSSRAAVWGTSTRYSAVKAAGGCTDLRQGQRVTVLRAYHNTSIVHFDGDLHTPPGTYIVANIDFTVETAASQDTAPPPQASAVTPPAAPIRQAPPPASNPPPSAPRMAQQPPRAEPPPAAQPPAPSPAQPPAQAQAQAAPAPLPPPSQPAPSEPEPPPPQPQRAPMAAPLASATPPQDDQPAPAKDASRAPSQADTTPIHLFPAALAPAQPPPALAGLRLGMTEAVARQSLDPALTITAIPGDGPAGRIIVAAPRQPAPGAPAARAAKTILLEFVDGRLAFIRRVEIFDPRNEPLADTRALAAREAFGPLSWKIPDGGTDHWDKDTQGRPIGMTQAAFCALPAQPVHAAGLETPAGDAGAVPDPNAIPARHETNPACGLEISSTLLTDPQNRMLATAQIVTLTDTALFLGPRAGTPRARMDPRDNAAGVPPVQISSAPR